MALVLYSHSEYRGTIKAAVVKESADLNTNKRKLRGQK